MESAELAVFISDLLREEDPQKSPYLYQLRGYAWAHDGNARRVLGDLRNADESFSIAEAWWEAGEVEVGDALGFEPVILDHKASLRIAQRRFSDAFEMLGNVMDNAAKWARSRVLATARREGGRLVIRVDDDGAGFSDTQSVLGLHVRGDERVPGHGVGLAVVNDLVASHRGELKLGRSDLGGGRVEIVLPAA